MKKIIVLFAACFLCLTNVASAHVMNEDKMYTDLNSSAPNAQQALLLNSIGLIGNTAEELKLSQDEKLTRKELAAWIGGFFGLEGSTFDEKANASLHEEYISSLEGDATYEDINIALFHRTLTLDNPKATLTKAEYIDFIYNNLNTDMNGHTLLQMGGFSEGPTGDIQDVKVDDHSITLIIDGNPYVLSGHPRISAKSVEPTDWIGQTVELSYYGTAPQEGHDHSHGEHGDSKQAATLLYVQLAKAENKEENAKNVSTEDKVNTEVKKTNEDVSKETKKDFGQFLVPAIAVILLLVVGIFVWKRKNKK